MFSYLYHLLSRTFSSLIQVILWVLNALWWIIRMVARVFLAVARPAMQYLAFLFFIAAIIALVSDLTPLLSEGRGAELTSFGEHWNAISPRTFLATENSINDTTGQWLWQLLNTILLNLPTFLIFGIFGALTAYAGRRRKSLEVFVN